MAHKDALLCPYVSSASVLLIVSSDKDFCCRALYNHTSRRTLCEMTVLVGDILCVVDTAYQDQIGNWYAYKLSCSGGLVEQGCIPSHQR